ncbi:MAG: flagellar hook-associated protein FlgK [Hyphomicrobiales bacterium]
MSLSQSLNISLAGLNATQRGLDVVAGNIANAETEGYTRKTISQTALVSDDRVNGVRVGEVERVLDAEVQSQARSLAGVNVGNGITADYLGRLDSAFGSPGEPTAIDTTFNNAIASLEALSTSPEDFNAQIQAVNDLQVFTSQLNSLSNTIQDLRQEADLGIQQSIAQANDALAGLEEVNRRILTNGSASENSAFLEDERDQFIDQLAQLIDIEVTPTANNGVNITTTTGLTLFSSSAAQLNFTQAGTVVANSSTENGTLFNPTVSLGANVRTNLLGPIGVQEGAIAAYGEIRDDVLVEVQSQLDAFAAQISLAISNVDVDSTAVAGGLAVDTAGIVDGNEVSLDFTNATGQTQSVTLVQVSDPSLLPVDSDFTANPNDIVIGVDFNSPTAAADIQAALNAELPTNGITFATTGTTLSVTTAGAASVGALSANITNSGFTDNGVAFALFQDGASGDTFTNEVGANGSQVGYAGRIQLSDEVLADPSLLSQFTSGVGNSGDSSRVDFVLEQINDDLKTISPDTGIGSASNPITTTVADFLQTIISTQGQRSESAQNASDASQISFNNVQSIFQSESEVNIDVELARLIELEQAFQANARVLTTIQDLADALFNAVR